MKEEAIFNQVSDTPQSRYGISEGLKILFSKKDELIELCKKHHLKKLYTFGSALEKSFSDESDFDFLIQFEEIPFDQYTDHFFMLHEDLENLLGRKIDLLTDQSLTNKYFQEKVIQTRLLLYAA